jgi:hypothetical protein
MKVLAHRATHRNGTDALQFRQRNGGRDPVQRQHTGTDQIHHGGVAGGLIDQIHFGQINVLNGGGVHRFRHRHHHHARGIIHIGKLHHGVDHVRVFHHGVVVVVHD